jgi:hypothetical protein
MADELFHVVKSFVTTVAGLLHQMLSIQMLSDPRISGATHAMNAPASQCEKSSSLQPMCASPSTEA